MKTIEGVLKVEHATKIETCEKHGEYESRNYFGNIWSKCLSAAKSAQRSSASKLSWRCESKSASAGNQSLGLLQYLNAFAIERWTPTLQQHRNKKKH